MMQLKWKQSTRDRWIAELPGGASLSIDRPRSWKKLKLDKPWRARVLGNNFPSRTTFAEASDAMSHAENMLRSTVTELAKALGVFV